MPQWDEGPTHWDLFTVISGNDPLPEAVVDRAPEVVVAVDTGMWTLYFLADK